MSTARRHSSWYSDIHLRDSPAYDKYQRAESCRHSINKQINTEEWTHVCCNEDEGIAHCAPYPSLISWDWQELTYVFRNWVWMDTFVTHPLKLNVILHCTWHETCSQMVDSSVIHIWHKNGRLLIFRTPLCCSFVSFSGSLPLEILPAFPHVPSLAISVALRFGFRILARIVCVLPQDAVVESTQLILYCCRVRSLKARSWFDRFYLELIICCCWSCDSWHA